MLKRIALGSSSPLFWELWFVDEGFIFIKQTIAGMLTDKGSTVRFYNCWPIELKNSAPDYDPIEVSRVQELLLAN